MAVSSRQNLTYNLNEENETLLWMLQLSKVLEYTISNPPLKSPCVHA